jgi:hypothetical protein
MEEIKAAHLKLKDNESPDQAEIGLVDRRIRELEIELILSKFKSILLDIRINFTQLLVFFVKLSVKSLPGLIIFSAIIIIGIFLSAGKSAGSCPTSWCKLVSVITTTSGFSRMVMLPRRAG